MNAQNCLSEALHPCTFDFSLSEGQARLRLQMEGEATLIWLLHFLETWGQFEFPYLRIQVRESREYGEAHLQASLLWTDYCSSKYSFELNFVRNNNVQRCSAVKTKQNKNLSYLSGHEHKEPNRAEEETEVPARESTKEKETFPSPFRVQRKELHF